MRRTVIQGKERVEYELRQTSRRSVQLRALPDGLVVFAPAWMKLRDVDAYVRANAEWIAEAKANLARYREAREAAFPMTDGSLIPLEGKWATLRVREGAGETRLAGAELIVYGEAKSSLEAFLIERAKARFAERLAHFAPIVGRSPGRVTVRHQKTRWGSCSQAGNINLNWTLIMAPPEALDYVVIHELCHLYEFNHSAAFWARVANHQPDYAKWRDFLRSGWKKPF